MKIGGIIVCRMDSVRMPGKVLRRAGGRPVLWWILERVARANEVAEACGSRGLDAIIVATTARAVDREIAASVADYRALRERSLAAESERAREGSLAPVVFEYGGRVEDVSGRLLAAADANGLDALARVNADSPFVDPSLLARACQLIRDSADEASRPASCPPARVERTARGSGVELVTNLAPRTYPYGVSVEMVATRAYRALLQGVGPQEHPMRPVYAALDRLAWVNLAHDGAALDGLRMTLDTEDDWDRFEEAIVEFGSAWVKRDFATFVSTYASAFGGGSVTSARSSDRLAPVAPSGFESGAGA